VQRLRRHRQQRVLRQHRDDRGDVGGVPGVDQAADEGVLRRRVGAGMGPRHAAGAPLLLQRRAGALEGTVDAGDARRQHRGNLGRRIADDVAEQETGPLPGRQELDGGDEGEFDALLPFRRCLRTELIQ
jgi:hypothetical protein